jgi:hypothetical protein
MLIRLLIGLSCLTLAGCGTVPDLQPFAASTAQISSSVRSVGGLVISDAKMLSDEYRSDAQAARRSDGPESEELRASSERLSAAVQNLQTAWGANIRMMEAVEGYSTSLAAIAAAGKSGKASAAAVGDSLKALLDEVGSPVPGANTVLSLAAKAYGCVAEARAAASLEQAVEQTQPAIDEVAKVIKANLENLAQVNRFLSLQLASNQEDNTRAGFDARRERGLLLRATVAQDEVRSEIQDALKIEDKDARDTKLAAITRRARLIEEIVAVSRARLAPVDAAVVDVRTRGERQQRFIEASIAATDAWVGYHRRLLVALREKQVPSVQTLLGASEDVRQLLELIRSKS